MNHSCSNCAALYYGPLPNQAGVVGHQCRRHPPQILMIPKGTDMRGNLAVSVDAFWPVMNLKEDPGCADWLPSDARNIMARDTGLDS